MSHILKIICDKSVSTSVEYSIIASIVIISIVLLLNTIGIELNYTFMLILVGFN